MEETKVLLVAVVCWGQISEGDYTWRSYAWSAREGRVISMGSYSMLHYPQLGDATYKMFLGKENLQKLFEPFHCHVSLSK